MRNEYLNMGEKVLYYIGESTVQKFGHSSLLLTLTKPLRMMGLKEKDKVDVFYDPNEKKIIIKMKKESILDKTIVKI